MHHCEGGRACLTRGVWNYVLPEKQARNPLERARSSKMGGGNYEKRAEKGGNPGFILRQAQDEALHRFKPKLLRPRCHVRRVAASHIWL
jgi:hypothetical protein